MTSVKLGRLYAGLALVTSIPRVPLQPEGWQGLTVPVSRHLAIGGAGQARRQTMDQPIILLL